MSDISAEQLGDAFEDPVAADFLAPEERAALDRVGDSHSAPAAAVASAGPPPPQGRFAKFLDDAGKVGIALLSVGITVGAFIAPLFLL